MIRKILQSFQLAIENIRANFFHTVLSVLGIVIGVAALVSILSLIDGMQDFAKKQISATTSLTMISVSTEMYKRSNGISIRKDSVDVLQYENLQALKGGLSKPARCILFHRSGKEVKLVNDTTKAAIYATAVVGMEADSLLAGRTLLQADVDSRDSVCVVTEALAKIFNTNDPRSIVDKKIHVGNKTLTVVGVILLKHTKEPELLYPFTLTTLAELKNNPSQAVVEAENVTDVPELKKNIEAYLKGTFSSPHDFNIATNEFRVEQAAKGFLLFKIIMGLIVGISVVVGGIGVMNVLLISVTQRTSEIGIRKALGANRRDIVLLFLSESVTVSAFGSLLGLIFGTLFTMATVPIVSKLTEMPFYASYTMNTFILIAIIAVLVGIIFGTYPAIRASKLNPVDAIRHE
jgi:putative ABC transport system permease protein